MEALAVDDLVPPVAAADVAEVASRSVLVVDDRKDLREICCLILEQAGFTVTEAEDSSNALRMLNAGPLPEVVLIDVTMPGMSGPNAVATMRDRHPNVTPVLMTGYSAEAIGAMLEEQGVGLLRKPFNNAELIAAVNTALAD